MSKYTGGPAFPCLEAAMTGIDSDGEERWETEPHGGMTLRDYFASNCDIGNVDELSLVTGVRLLGEDCPPMQNDPIGCLTWWANFRAKMRYIEADAMLKARES